MPTQDSYDPRLYQISKKIHVAKNDGDPYNEPMAIHNALLPFYRQLSDNLTYNKNDWSSYMPVIDLDTASDDSLEKLCTFI